MAAFTRCYIVAYYYLLYYSLDMLTCVWHQFIHAERFVANGSATRAVYLLEDHLAIYTTYRVLRDHATIVKISMTVHDRA